ncbi:MAG: hypothetical protein U0842_02545 [Candidatus Binatia bacterium]
MTHAVVAFHDRLWVLGGQQITYFDPDGGDAVADDVWSSAGATWTLELAHAPWAARGQILGAAVFDDHMWLIGGGTYNDPRHYYRDVWKSADGVQWGWSARRRGRRVNTTTSPCSTTACGFSAATTTATSATSGRPAGTGGR